MGCKTGLLGAGRGLVARVSPLGSVLMRAQEKLRSEQGLRQVRGLQIGKFMSPSPGAAGGAVGLESSILGCSSPCAALPDSVLPGSLSHVPELQQPIPGAQELLLLLCCCEAEEKQVLLVCP